MAVRKTVRKIHFLPAFSGLFFLVFFTGFQLYRFSRPIPIPKVYRMVLPSDNKSQYGYNDYMLEKQFRKKKMIRVYLTGNKQKDANKLDFIRQEALRLQYTCDTTQVVAVHFSDACTYGQFLYLLQMVEVDGHKRYAFWKDWFYILGEEPPQEEPVAAHDIQPIYL